jgi:hypothetical protein
MKEAMTTLGRALKSASKEDAAFLQEIKTQIDEAVKADPKLDKQLEFCYAIVFAPDKVKNESLMKAAKFYINVSEGKI